MNHNGSQYVPNITVFDQVTPIHVQMYNINVRWYNKHKLYSLWLNEYTSEKIYAIQKRRFLAKTGLARGVMSFA